MADNESFVTIIPAEPGWRALRWYVSEETVELEEIPVVCWGLHRAGFGEEDRNVPPSQWNDPERHVTFDDSVRGFGPTDGGLRDLEEGAWGWTADEGYLRYLSPGESPTPHDLDRAQGAARWKRKLEKDRQAKLEEKRLAEEARKAKLKESATT